MHQNLALRILHLRVVSAWYFGFVMKASVLVPEMEFEDQQLSPEVLTQGSEVCGTDWICSRSKRSPFCRGYL